MTTGTDATYENRSTRVLRGLEARTIKKWEDDGWEVVSQEHGKLRTTITFRRPRPKSHRVLWIVGGATIAVVLAAIITIGVINERSAAPIASESAATDPPPSSEASQAPSVSPTSTEIAGAQCSMLGASADCTFGQTVLYTDTTGDGDVALEITVLAPVEFTPTSNATFWNSRATQVPGLPLNIYFPVTIKNVSDQPRDSSFILTQAVNDEERATDILTVSDGDVASYLNFDTLVPGESYVFNDGWSLSTLDGLEFEIRIDGLAGGSVTFTN
ncbi:hypothetical protein ACLBXX_09440 [Microbacterium sp. C23T]